ncbi:FapA family protein [Paenibacillus sp.]|uniref:FapA family protein n=1 Tax=Paenibacillus sp. TaxID=58172 RepID=UPI002D3EA177|nr:FapA family protein [Paenibacillus sp.]HZG84373.1 FapA family protein [Paenibacillus sp.]
MAADFPTNLGAAVAVSVSEDRMSAFMQLIDPDAAGSLSKEGLEQLLKANGVVFGILEGALADFLINPLSYVSAPLLIAQGTHPVPGKDGFIENLFNSENRQRKPLELEGGAVDYRELMQLNNASKGQLIAQRVLPTKGTPGMAVTGETIPGKDGKEVRFKLGKNVVVDAEKMNMYAVIDGLVTVTERGKINVFPVYEVNGDVDYSVGNIDFIGTVVVRGSVLTGFRIKAAGDIRITGGVEGAEVEAEGSVDIASGIFAAGKGFVKAGLDVKSSFMQEANVYAGQNVIVSQSILHSNVRAGKSVVCKGTKGLIVGGSVQAGEYIQARTVGNTTSTATALEVGVSPELRAELVQLRSAIKQISENLDKTEKALTLLDQMAAAGTLTQEKLEMRSKLQTARRATTEELTAAKERIWEIESSLEDIEKAKVEIIGTVYAGTKVVIGRYTRFIKDSTTRVAFQLQGGEITLSSHM